MSEPHPRPSDPHRESPADDGSAAMERFLSPARRQDRDLAPAWTREPVVMLARQVVQAGLLGPVVRLLGDFQFRGQEHLDGLEPPLIIAANHSSHADVICIREAVPRAWRHDLVAAAAADYFFDKPLRMVLSSLSMNTLPLERHDSPRRSLKTAVRVLRGGAALIIFPEGSRTLGEPRLRSFQPGVAFLCKHAEVPVVPLCIWGSHRLMPKEGGIRPHPVRLQFGEPLRLGDGERLQAFTERIRGAVRECAIELGAWPLVFDPEPTG
ncbi:MAG: lysophospholipid acyltransferase family protein [Candidatus Dormibacteria bacterium]